MKEFYENRNENIKTSSIPKLVTHHWSTNPKKGFEFYKKLDKFCKETNKFEFTYIGRKPDNCKFVNSLPPIDVEKLSKELPKHDIYITASIEEAGANHVLEALACALPVVYHKLGGSIEDYCNNYGKAYMTFDESVNSIETIVKDYQTYKDNVLKYNVTNDDTINEYLNIIEGFI
jgi:glycosyltransferase involved in cell wall biosynthesis